MEIFITRGMRLSIPAGGLKIGFDKTKCHVEVGIELFPFWLEIALHHLRLAKVAHSALEEAHAAKDDVLKGAHLETVFVHAMQSTVASATAVDAFYGSIKDLAKYRKEELAAIRESKTSRPVRIKETIRRVFQLGPKPTAQIDKILTSIYRLRDHAVHPPADYRSPVYYAPIEAAVEWRFVAFSYSNARECLSGTLSLLRQLLRKEAKADGLTQSKCVEMLALIEGVSKDWEAGFETNG